MALYGQWSLMDQYGPIWSRMVLYGPVWYHMVLYGPLLPSMASYDTVDHVCFVRVTCGALWFINIYLFGPSGLFIVQYGPTWSGQ